MAQFKGLDTFLEVVDVISDPKKYQAKVDELKQLTANYVTAIESVVALASVNDYTQNIRKREESSKIELETARKDAAEIRAKAREWKEAQEASIRNSQNAIQKENQNIKALLDAAKVESANQAKEAAAIMSWKIELDARENKLAQAEQELAVRQAKLKAALS